MSVDLTVALRLLLSAALGAIIGYQRERAGKPAGLRTHMLICIGSALFTVASIYGFDGQVDPSRVAAGVVAGIGFIGAGAIIFRSNEGYVVGLTTAASMWVVAAIGLTAGLGMYVASTVTTVLALIVLFLPHHIK